MKKTKTNDMTLIADSGSTKTSWRLDGQAFETIGINPVRDSEEEVRRVIQTLPQAPVSRIFFYGAGCIAPYKDVVRKALRQHYPTAEVSVESDMLGAARATCGREAGIAGILGTGSNSCLYDGEAIIQNISPLGYILGDEGSGAVLGRTLVGDALKGQLGDALKERFLERFQLTPQLIIERVYRQPMPNRFLASLVPFLHEEREEPAIRQLLLEQFRRYLRRNIAAYLRPDLPVHLVGGIAAAFQPEIAQAAATEGLQLGQIIKNPVEHLVKYHTKNR